ncbi:hypothetical protein CEE44_03625 [Candidatus Woesearchaeota archaeon B3_Woes]|nr:MAG: hypothetical protein CEE44_03625 [Candidatus Woesearchaeota archaeon B3_Woes]
MGIFGWLFRRKKKELAPQQPIKKSVVSKGGPLTKNLSANLGVISNHLSNLGEKAREVSKQEGVRNVRGNLYKAKRSVQIAIRKLNK